MAVLTSAGITFGDATTQTTAATAGALVTTANVLSATAGASFAAVGTYATLASSDGSSITAGSTKAGSGLRASAVVSIVNEGVSIHTGALQSGTWRAMGTGQTNSQYFLVFLRIS